MSQKLYVGNLSYNTTEGELETLFSQSGTVESVRVMRDMATGRARGFGFVEMATQEEAQAAITAFHGYEFGGRQLTVNEARPMEARGGGGGKFGGGGGGNRGGGFGGGNGGGRGGRRQEPRW